MSQENYKNVSYKNDEGTSVQYASDNFDVCVEDGTAALRRMSVMGSELSSTMRRGFRVILGSHDLEDAGPDSQHHHDHTKEYWITRYFKGATCNRFIKDPTDYKDSTLCKCGRYYKDHERSKYPCIDEPDSNVEWTPETCTASFTTNAYGHINFTKVEADVLPKYLRFKHDTDIKLIKELLKDRWNLPKTYLIMVVIGGLGGLVPEVDDTSAAAKHGFRRFNQERRDLINQIKDGLVEAALSTQAWIITGGLANGVSKLVGEAVGRRRTFTETIPTLGIAAWGTVRDRNQLEDDKYQGLFPANYTVTDESKMPGQKALDINHTAFLFPDWGTHRNYHVNEMSSFKIRLEEELKVATDSTLITILIEGGLSSLIETGERVKNKIPIVVMSGTGRAADLIGHARAVLPNYNGVDDPAFLKELERQFDTLFTKSRDRIGNRKQAFDAIKTILKNKHLVTIWDSSAKDVGKIDKAILLGLINSLADPHKDVSSISETCRYFTQVSGGADTTDTSCHVKDVREFNQLELAIKWNRLDLAVEHLFKGKDFSVDQLNELLWVALEHKNINFVTSIMKKGANLKRFLTEKRFWTYLNSNTLVDRSPLKKLMSSYVSRHVKDTDQTLHDSFIYEHFLKVIYRISQGVYKCPKKKMPSDRSNDLVSKKGNLIKELMSCGLGYYQVKKDNMANYCMRNGKTLVNGADGRHLPEFEDPENLLVLYFVLIYEHELAKCLWRYSNTPLILSLICAHMCGWLAAEEKKSKEITGEDKDQLLIWRTDWEGLALDILDETNKNYGTKWVQSLVKHRFYSWGGRSSLELAVLMKSHKFLAHPGVHKYVTDCWMGSLDPDTSYSSILLGIFITPVFIDIRKFKRISPPSASDKQIRQKQKREFINQKKPLTRGNTRGDTVTVPVIRGNTLPLTELEAGQTQRKSSLIRSLRYYGFKFISFHRAPVTKYFVHLIFYLLFLMVFFCALVLNENNGKHLLGSAITDFSVLEWAVILYMLSSIPLEFRQVYHSMPSTLIAKLCAYIDNTYNKNDVASLVILLLAVLTKQGYFNLGEGPKYQAYDVSAYKTLMGLTFTLSTTRLLQFLQINSRMGPKVSTITRMLFDLLFFICIITIIMAAYGVATEAIIFPIGKETGIRTLWNIAWRPYIHLFGELDLDNLDDQLTIGYCQLNVKLTKKDAATEEDYNACASDAAATGYSCDDDLPCQYARIMVQVELAIYMMLASVLMLNLLIAVFSKTYDGMTKDNRDDMLWKWQRYDLMNEFKQRSALPFPFSLIAYVLRTVRWMWRRCCAWGSNRFFDRREAQKKNDEYKRAQISLLERECLRNIAKKTDDAVKKKVENDPEAEENSLNRRSVSPLKKHLPRLHGEEEEEEEEDQGHTEVDAYLAAPAHVLFASPTTPPPSRRFDPIKMYLEDIPENKCYPRSESVRFHLPAKKRDWSVTLPNYNPKVLGDNVLTEVLDGEWNVVGKNASYEGTYENEKGYPLNPLGRTGIFGRGHLPRYGPNFKSIPIVTRFQNPDQAPKLDSPLEVLVHFPDPDNQRLFNLPEFDAKADEPITKDFIELLFKNIHSTNAAARTNLKRILRRGILIKRGGVDSEYNTDNAWVEVFIASYHDDDQLALRAIMLKAASHGYGWISATEGMFKDKIHSRYFDRALYNRRLSQYLGAGISI